MAGRSDKIRNAEGCGGSTDKNSDYWFCLKCSLPILTTMSCGLSHLFSHMYVYGNSQRPVSHESDLDAQGYGTFSQNW